MSDETEFVEYDGDECDHDEVETDILTGRVTCLVCFDSWYPKRKDCAPHD